MNGIRILAAAFAAAIAFSAANAEAATAYVSEFANGVTAVGSQQAQVPPQPALADQAVALSPVSAQSSAFTSKTHYVSVICDEGCSISIGANPTATTSNFLLQQGTTRSFGVNPGQIIAIIENPAGNNTTSGGGTQVVNLAFVGGTTVSVGAGSADAGTLRTMIASDALIDLGTPGSQTSPTLTVQGDPSMTPLLVYSRASALGGCTSGTLAATASTNSTSMIGQAATLCSIEAFNTTTTLYYLLLYDKATAPTCNSDTIKATIPIPPAPSAGLEGGVGHAVGPWGQAGANGWGFCVTAAAAGTGNAATGIYVNYGTK